MICKKGAILIVLFVLVGIFGVNAEKLDINIDNNYAPGDQVKFKILVYDDSNNLLQEQAGYIIEDYYTEIVEEGTTLSGQENIFELPTDAIHGPWRITATYNDQEISRLFNVEELEKAKIELEGDELIVTNIGNVPYDKKILIYIGDQDQTADIRLEIGQTKNIRLTAPEGVYDVKVVGDVVTEDGQKENIEYSGVSLTGNVIGLESSVEGSFWRKYPLVGIFLIAIAGLAVVVAAARFRERFSGNPNMQNKPANKGK